MLVYLIYSKLNNNFCSKFPNLKLIFYLNFLEKNQNIEMTTGNQFAALFKDETNVSSKSSYENAFPSLGKEENLCSKHPFKSDLESEFKTEIIHRSSGKNTQTKIILGHRSYEDDIREKYPYYKQKDISSHSANAEKLVVSLVKSRMCISVDKNEKCQNGYNCRFAHSLDDLRISDCLF